ncbi:TonB-dependent siderophore receptor [Bradyrhizobium symbiodeficiens]|uniref:TonB-dependent siderophore receptor n=1 Tax=Bradyrhizobium symbiodeficiens TaxID=1404367 RepID=UPI000BA1B439|nr:TonB-dependent siderophore receptor [Bradyrhizobium symbiodeficiens]AWM09684.1 TonB-dependent siderophore receptor [Bradyrhizobium symbiodeficiens]
MGAVGSIVLVFGAGEAAAQSSSAPTSPASSSELSPVVVESREAPKRARAPSSRSRGSAARARAASRSNAAASAAAAGASGTSAGRKESAFGHVDGMVATRSGTGTKTDTPLIETPAAISVVTQDQIQAQGAQSIAQAVRYTPGVRSEFAGADARTDAVYVRGFLADQYLDSLRLLNFGIFAYSLVEPFNLERVEVLHGPASILYGQSSPGGLVDMVSKRPTLDPYHEMFVSTGSYGRMQAGVDLSGPIDKNKEFLYRFIASGFDVGSQVDHGDYQRISIAPSLTWRPDNNTTLTVLGTYQRDPKAGFYNQLPPLGVGTVTPFKGAFIPTSFYSGEPGFDKTDRTYGSVGYLFEHSFNNSVKVRQNLRYTDLSTDFAVVSPFGPDPSNLPRGAYTTLESIRSIAVDNQVETRFHAGPIEHTVLAGIDYRNGVDKTLNGTIASVSSINAFNPVYGQSFGPVPFTTRNRQRIDQVGEYIQDQIKYDHWVALLGIRHDLAQSCTDSTALASNVTTTSPKSDTAVTKRGALLYKFDNGIAPYIQYTESFQPTAGTTFAGSPFVPTTGKQEEVGIKYQPNDKSLYTIAAFNLVQQNVLTPDTDPTHGVGQRVQTGEIRSRGIEFEAKTEVNRELTVLASYTYLDNVVTKTNTGTQLGKHPVGFPMNSASVWADYTFRGGALDGFGLSGGVRYIGELPGNTANTFYVPAVTLFDAAIHYDFSALGPMFKGYSAQVNATNLFDKTYVTYCQDGGCYYGLRRNVIATLRYKW